MKILKQLSMRSSNQSPHHLTFLEYEDAFPFSPLRRVTTLASSAGSQPRAMRLGFAGRSQRAQQFPAANSFFGRLKSAGGARAKRLADGFCGRIVRCAKEWTYQSFHEWP
jgi:hypothetical protein